MTLFIKYQVPSDLLSYSGSIFESVEFKIQQVKEYTAGMLEYITMEATDEKYLAIMEKLKKGYPYTLRKTTRQM